MLKNLIYLVKNKNYIQIGLLILLGFLFILHLIEIYTVIFHSEEYPFGGAMFTRFSIYTSRGVYLIYQVISLFIIIFIMPLLLKGIKRKRLVLLCVFYLILFLYPLLTNY